jgi:hypothetical protein
VSLRPADLSAASGWTATRSGAALVAGHPPATTEALDRREREHEALAAAGLTLVRPVHPDDRPIQPDLARAASADGEVEELEREIAAALAELDASLVLHSERGDDTVGPVVHRPTGRIGFTLDFLEHDVPPIEICSTLGGVVAARSQHPVLRLAPDGLWSTPLGGLRVVLWCIAPAAPCLPTSPPLGPGLDPAISWLTARASRIADCADGLVLQVVGTGAPRVIQDLPGAVALLEGTRPGWVELDGPAFADRWTFGWNDRAAAVLQALRGAPEVRAAQVIPGTPLGLELLAPTLQSVWTRAAERFVGRHHDGCTERDLLEVAQQRPRTPTDAMTDLALLRALAVRGGAARLHIGTNAIPSRAITDTTGRAGLAYTFEPSSFKSGPLRLALSAVGSLTDGELLPVATYAHRSDHTVVHLWFQHATDPEAQRRWG